MVRSNNSTPQRSSSNPRRSNNNRSVNSSRSGIVSNNNRSDNNNRNANRSRSGTFRNSNHSRNDRTNNNITNNNHYHQQEDFFICNLCQSHHSVKHCKKFLKMNVSKRERFLEHNRFCTNCLARSHDWRACNSLDRCKKCDTYHHTLLHPRPRSKLKLTFREHSSQLQQTIQTL